MARITVGVSGGIGAYKAAEVVRGLQQHGHDVTVVMTRSARRFVGELTFEALTKRRVVTSQWAPGLNADIEHIALATASDLLLVVPATANTIAKFAHGLADDFLSSLYLATTAPVLLAPAMNTHMLEHPAVQENLQTLARRGVRFVDPGEGYLACGWVGKGRLAEPDEIVAAAARLLAPAAASPGALAGKKVMVTAGPTFEDLDPVRFIGNRSSGRMGFAVAAEAAARGATVTLVSGPTHLDPPPGVSMVRVRSAADMHAAVMTRAGAVDAVVMAAAVADYTPETVAGQKVAKGEDGWTVPLKRTVDILADLGRLPSRAAKRPVLIGFAAETHDLLAHADAKRRRKNVDLIVANDVTQPGSGFEVETNAVTFLDDAGTEATSLLPKSAVAGRILDRLAALLGVPATPVSQ
jgi:phosphopantothenoylcysteine decarboxylase / phosphopantothenate---cysteine ligase